MSIWKMGASGNYEAEQAARVEWFKKIEPAGNWKLAINAWIEASEFEDCNQAAVWFAGCELKIAESKGSKVRVEGAGYYAAIGA